MATRFSAWAKVSTIDLIPGDVVTLKLRIRSSYAPVSGISVRASYRQKISERKLAYRWDRLSDRSLDQYCQAQGPMGWLILLKRSNGESSRTVGLPLVRKELMEGILKADCFIQGNDLVPADARMHFSRLGR